MKPWVCLTWVLGILWAFAPWGEKTAAGAAWEPQKPVEFIIPAGQGGGADVMARFITPLIAKYNLSSKPFVVINKSGGAGAEGFTYVKAKKGDPHVIIITLSNVFTTPLATGVPFTWKDLTPVARLALDEFILWVHAETPYTSVNEYLTSVKEKPAEFKMGGTGTAQEDQIITIQIEQAAGVKFTYVPFRGGGEVCANLVGKHVDSTVNNPSECVGHWKAGRVRPLAVFDTERLRFEDWKMIPTMKEVGHDITYLMLRGIFAAPDISPEAQAFYVELMRKVTETAEFKKYTEDNALKLSFLTGAAYVKWLAQAEALHKDLMQRGGLLKQ
ncbi:MAG: tripartite tricarboxylate transporter substrate binding protein [Nitrospinae bacterium]|nr:tripartite tricarboxylate transporter substrate binding protein [Nitrospinota bacterium]